MIGRTISRYKIIEKLGEGGMGVVYKAEDTRLKRQVALKFLVKQALADEEEKERFLREAQAAAALDHPNICTVYEIDDVEGETFIAMAYVDGQSLKHQILGGPMDLSQALGIAISVGRGVQEAHDNEVVHRDIKCANILLTKKGEPKITDFGVAHLAGQTRLTRTGTMLGTPCYMAPEQAQGLSADRRADVWALGVVLYEMVTGLLPFGARHEHVVVYDIINTAHEPVTARRAGVPIEFDYVLSKVLAKKPEDRYQGAADLVVDLRRLREQVEAGEFMATAASATAGGTRASSIGRGLPPTQIMPPGTMAAQVSSGSGEPVSMPAAVDLHPPRKWDRVRGYQAALLVTTLVALIAVGLWVRTPAPPEPFALKFSLMPGSDAGHPAISPDGRKVAYIRGRAPQSLIWVQSLDSEEPRELPGTNGADTLFWAPDSVSLAFQTRWEVKRIAVDGGAATTLCQKPREDSLGGAWHPDGGTLAFVAESSGSSVVYEVSARGGNPTTLFEAGEPEARRSLAHPYFLPTESGGRFLILQSSSREGKSEIVLLNADSGEEEVIGEGTRPTYSSSGHIIYQTAGGEPAVWALPFSLSSLEVTGAPFPIAENGTYPTVTAQGSLAYLIAPLGGTDRLVWRGRGGEEPVAIGRPQVRMGHAALSPDNRFVAIRAAERGIADIWIHETARSIATRVTGGTSVDMRPVWFPSGDEVAFNAQTAGNLDIFRVPIHGDAEPKPILATEGHEGVSDISADGKYLLFIRREKGAASGDLWYLERGPGGKWEPKPFMETPFDETDGQFSPDGRFVVYLSDESGERELYVRRFPTGTGKWQVSTHGARQPRWSRDGGEIFYVEADTLVAAKVTTERGFSVEASERLFRSDYFQNSDSHVYDVSSDGQRFVIPDAAQGSEPPRIRVVLNWFEEFRDRE